MSTGRPLAVPVRGKRKNTPPAARPRLDWVTWAAVVVAAVVIGGIAISRAVPHGQPPGRLNTTPIGRRVPAMALASTSHGRISLAAFRGHFVVLFFYEGAT
jgi:hypothetical protein